MITTELLPLVPPGILPKCDARGCRFRFQRPGWSPDGPTTGYVLEHHDVQGQVHGKTISAADIENPDLDIWESIAPFYRSLHDEEPA